MEICRIRINRDREKDRVNLIPRSLLPASGCSDSNCIRFSINCFCSSFSRSDVRGRGCDRLGGDRFNGSLTFLDSSRTDTADGTIVRGESDNPAWRCKRLDTNTAARNLCRNIIPHSLKRFRRNENDNHNFHSNHLRGYLKACTRKIRRDVIAPIPVSESDTITLCSS